MSLKLSLCFKTDGQHQFCLSFSLRKEILFHLDASSINCKHQYGLGKRPSPYMLPLADKVTSALENNEFTRGTLSTFQKPSTQ